MKHQMIGVTASLQVPGTRPGSLRGDMPQGSNLLVGMITQLEVVTHLAPLLEASFRQPQISRNQQIKSVTVNHKS